MNIFASSDRGDRSPRRPNESSFAFLNRSGSDFFVPVRELLLRWVDALPSDARPEVVGKLSSGDDHAFDGAFWELYLHQLLTGSGVDVEVHPDVPGTSKHPDFLVHAAQPFYLEASKVGAPPEKLTSERRLRDVEAILHSTRVYGWTLSFTWHRIGPRPLRATGLRNRLVAWLDGLDRFRGDDEYADRPLFSYDEDGWKLSFTALPVGSDQASLVAIRGAGRASGVDNKSGLDRVLSVKSRRYGTNLPYPLVTAILSNTEFPTRLYEVQPTLYGRHWLGPSQVTDFTELSTDGHWRTTRGWRRSHNPYVIVGSGIHLYTMHKTVPWLWRTLDPSVTADLDMPWAAPVDVTVAEPKAPLARANLAALGVTDDWCSGEPDFDES